MSDTWFDSRYGAVEKRLYAHLLYQFQRDINSPTILFVSLTLSIGTFCALVYKLFNEVFVVAFNEPLTMNCQSSFRIYAHFSDWSGYTRVNNETHHGKDRKRFYSNHICGCRSRCVIQGRINRYQ